jgi:hypothetical protein
MDHYADDLAALTAHLEPRSRRTGAGRMRSPDIGADGVHAVDPKMLRELDDELSHRFGRHQVGTAFGSAEARQVDHDQRAKRLDCRQDPAEGVDAFRPRAGQEDGDAVGATATRKTNLQAVYLCCSDMADIRKTGAHRMLLEVTGASEGSF